jgi:hypothetical protein
MWRLYFKLVKLVPGKVIVQGYGTLDFSRDDIPVETCKALYETDFEFLEITEEGMRELYGTLSPALSKGEGTEPAASDQEPVTEKRRSRKKK